MKKEDVKIIIVDDHQLFAEGLKRIIEDTKRFTVSKICNNWEKLRLSLNTEIPKLIMLDIQMKGTNGIEICKIVKQKYPSIKIIFISMLETPTIISQSKEVGANGFIPKTTDAILVKRTIENVLKGIDSFINFKQTDASVAKNKLHLITKREKEIIELIKIGNRASEIAQKLAISKYTVDTHRKNILKKLQLNSSKELIGFAFKNYF